MRETGLKLDFIKKVWYNIITEKIKRSVDYLMKVNMSTALQIKGIGANIVDKKMPTKIAYKFMKLLKAET